MRALFAFAGGSGHAEPLVPIATALRAAGYAVAFAGRSDVAAGLRARGFVAFDEPVDTTGPLPEPAPLLVPDIEREERAVREVYAARIAAARAASVTDVCGSWRPDVVVCDELDFGAMLAAERLGLPHASVLVIAVGSFVRPALVAEPLNALRALGERPVVYVTLGTIFNMESGDLLERVAAGLGALPVDVVVTVGPGRDPADLGAQPPHVRVERHVSHAHLLPRCALVVSHGGSGTLVDALAAGLPSLLLPLGADQPLNAARCEMLGVGLALDAVHATPAVIAASAAALPSPDTAVALLEALVAAG